MAHPLTLHHLHLSQSERIVFLLEELSIPYNLTLHDRDPVTALSPSSLKSLHTAGTAPLLLDSSTSPPTQLAESAAIVEYIINTHAPDSGLIIKPGELGYADYLTWFHFANGTVQPNMSRYMFTLRIAPPSAPSSTSPDEKPTNPYVTFIAGKLNGALSQLDARLKFTGAYLAGSRFTAADVMTVFTLSTMRGFAPVDLGQYDAILAYLERVGQREAYKKALVKAEGEGFVPMLGAKAEPFQFGKLGAAKK